MLTDIRTRHSSSEDYTIASRGRSVVGVLIAALLLAACALRDPGTSNPLATDVFRDDPADAPPSSPTPSALASAPSPSASGSEFGLAPWPGQLLFEYPPGVAVFVGEDANGTIYTLHQASRGSASPNLVTSLYAFNADGVPIPGYGRVEVAQDAIPFASFVTTDGVAFVAAIDQAAMATEHVTATISAVGPDGRLLSGFPQQTGSVLWHEAPLMVPHPAGGVCWLEVAGAASSEPTTTVECRDRRGSPLDGWPYQADTLARLPTVGPNATLYFFEANITGSGGRIVALDQGGSPRSDWTPYELANGRVTQILSAPDGTVYLHISGGDGPAIVRLNADGSVRDDWIAALPAGHEVPSGPLGVGMTLAADGTLYAATTELAAGRLKPSRLAAFGPTGQVRAGWPFEVDGIALFARAAPDEIVWAWWGFNAEDDTAPSALAALDTGGRLLPGWPVAAPPIRDLLMLDDRSAWVSVSQDGRLALQTIAADSVAP